MGFHKKPISIFIQLGLCASLLACAGAASENGGPAGAVGASPASGGQNILGGGGSFDGPGTGGNLPGAPGQGQAQPTTQEAAPAFYGPCKIHFIVTVKIIQNGAEQSCRESAMAAARRIATEEALGGTGTMAPPEDPGPGPEVTFGFITPNDIEERIEKVPTVCSPSGQWQTRDSDLHYYFIRHEDKCEGYTVKSHADWNLSGSVLSSDKFLGPPLSEYDDANNAYPISLNIDLGFGPELIQPSQTYQGH